MFVSMTSRSKYLIHVISVVVYRQESTHAIGRILYLASLKTALVRENMVILLFMEHGCLFHIFCKEAEISEEN